MENGGKNEAVNKSAEKEIRGKKSALEYFVGVFWTVVYGLWGYLLAGAALPFGAVPFGAAFLCSAEKRIPSIFIGLCLGAFGHSSPIVRIAAYAAVLLVRLLVCFTVDVPWSAEEGREIGEKRFIEVYSLLFCEKLNLRMASSCICVFITGLYFLVEGGFLYYHLYGALISLAAAPIATAAFAGLFGKRRENRTYRVIAFIALACALVFASRDINYFGISASAFGALFSALYITRKYGTVEGVLAGALCGLCYSPSLAPLFAFGALCGGIILQFSATLATVTTFTVSSAWGLYVKGIGALGGLLPAVLAASVLFAVVDKLFWRDGIADKKEKTAERQAADKQKAVCEPLAFAIDGIRLEDSENRIKSVCESFSELSSVFSSMSEMLRAPDEEDVRRICDNAFDSSCAGCAQKSVCWDENYRKTESEIASLCACVRREGGVCADDVGKELLSRCPRLSDILDEINHNARLHASRLLETDRTEIFAGNYASISDMIGEAVKSDRSEYDFDSQKSELACRELSGICDGIYGAAVFGRRKRRALIIYKSDSEAKEKSDAMLKACEKALGVRLKIESCDAGEDGLCRLLLGQTQRLAVSCARKTVRADGEDKYCGDTVGLFKTVDGRFYSYISDGMGAGRDAAVASGICALFLQKMLRAQNSCEATLRMLNGFLRNRGSGSLHECSATIDLFELDLQDGSAAFYKSGAAPTYVLRDGGLFKIRSKTLPVGILKETDTKRIGLDVGAGDTVVMVSDGVTQGREECPWLFDLLRSNINTVGIEKTAELIADYAKKQGATDDLSVLIVKIFEE